MLQFALSNSDVVGQNFVENVPKIHKKAKILALFKRKNLKKDLRINFSLLKAKKVGKIVL